jgi:hypothetical protein
MVKDGNTIADILQSVPESKRPIIAAMAEAFINGMITQEQLTSRKTMHNQRDRPA